MEPDEQPDEQEERRVVVVVDVDSVTRPDLAVIDALARLQLAARRLGGTIRIRNASKEFQGLLALSGLADVLPSCDDLRGEPRGQAEQWEELLVDVDEERDAADPPV